MTHGEAWDAMVRHHGPTLLNWLRYCLNSIGTLQKSHRKQRKLRWKCGMFAYSPLPNDGWTETDVSGTRENDFGATSDLHNANHHLTFSVVMANRY